MKNVNWIREDIKKVERAAARGNADAAFELAQRLMTGRKVDRDPAAAFEECSFAAKHGVAGASNMVGYCYATGTGVASDDRMALRSFKRAVKQGSVMAAFNLAVCYAEGIGLDEPDEEKADFWLMLAAAFGYKRARSALALRLLAESSAEEERCAGLHWLERAASKNDVLAAKTLAAYKKREKRKAAGLEVPPLKPLVAGKSHPFAA